MSEAEAQSDSLYTLLTALDLVTTTPPSLPPPHPSCIMHHASCMLILPSPGVQLLNYLKLIPTHLVVSPPLPYPICPNVSLAFFT